MGAAVSRFHDVTGEIFGRLTARRIVARDQIGRAIWECDCMCGGTKRTRIDNLVSGDTRSCGCLYRRAIALSLGIPTIEEHW